MFVSNPFAELSGTVAPSLMQAYVIVMIVLVVAGTLYDVMHKGSAKYFFQNWKDARKRATTKVSGAQIAGLAVKTAASEILTSSEFCNPNRRIAHLLGMYGLVLHVVATIVLVFSYPTSAAPAIWPLLWYLGALMVCIGGYWFWFFIRVDVNAEGHSPFRIMRADLFILALVGSATAALAWGITQAAGSSLSMVFLALYLIATTVLFGTVPWSKFSHMFFKPAAALQKRVEQADGSRSGLPEPANAPAKFGSARTEPNHY